MIYNVKFVGVALVEAKDADEALTKVERAAESVGIEPLGDSAQPSNVIESEDLGYLGTLRFNSFGLVR